MNPIVARPDESREFSTAERCSILEVWNDARDPGASIARARVAPGITTQPHRLHGVVERYLIVEGSGFVRAGDSIARAVAPGDVVVIPAEATQQITNTGNADLVFYCICTPRFTPGCYETLE
ncbi:MAG TPA: cupin domain-containing protein [Rudaea sp.]|nr:cupin domain-containing protein [Rudaea sp.]